MLLAYALGCAVFMALLLVFPAPVLAASRDALQLWLNQVLPSLLPFFVAANLLFASGAAHRAGWRLSPLLKRIGLPGAAAPVFLLGAVSGNPVGARLVGGFLSDGMLSLESGEQLILAANLAGPMFMLGTVANGMLGCGALGVALLVTHYASAICCALLYGLVYRPKSDTGSIVRLPPANMDFVGSFNASVAEGMLCMLRIGGIIILFSAFAAVLRASGLLSLLSGTLGSVFDMLHLNAQFAEPLLIGSLEMTIGCNAVAQLSAPLAAKAAACAFLLSFGGGSVLFQALSFANIRAGRYTLFRLMQGILAAALCYLWASSLSLPAFAGISQEKTLGLLALTSLSIALGAMVYSFAFSRHPQTSNRQRPRPRADDPKKSFPT